MLKLLSCSNPSWQVSTMDSLVFSLTASSACRTSSTLPCTVSTLPSMQLLSELTWVLVTVMLLTDCHLPLLGTYNALATANTFEEDTGLLHLAIDTGVALDLADLSVYPASELQVHEVGDICGHPSNTWLGTPACSRMLSLTSFLRQPGH